jgi:hypothetical protein
MEGQILPSVIKEHNAISNNLQVVKVSRSDDDIAEVTLVDQWNNTRRHSCGFEEPQVFLQGMANNWQALQACLGLDTI